MKRQIILFFLVVLLVFGASSNVFAVTSHVPLLQLTEQEKEYFSQLKSLRVLTAPSVQPYAYREAGVSIDILQGLCELAGVELDVIEAKSYEDALMRLENGEAELAAVKISQEENAVGIVPYLEAPIQAIHHKQKTLSEQSKLTVAQLQGLEFAYDKKYSVVDEITFASVRQCLDAVRGRQVDIFMCDIYQLSTFSDSFAAWDLTVNTVPLRGVTVGFGLRADSDARLASALQRATDSFGTSELTASLMRHMQPQEVGFRLTQFIYQHPFEIICVETSLFFIILLCMFVFFRVRSGQNQELRGYEDSYRMLANTFGEAGVEYDFLSDRFTFFGGRRERIDMPEVVEQAHVALAQGKLRLSLTPDDLDELLQNNAKEQSYQVELQLGMKEGNWNWYRMIYIVVCTSESHRRPIRLIGCLINIEDEHQEKERLLKIGYHDQLTGLVNRASGEYEIIQALDEDGGPKVLLFLDIDYFKNFNDQYGHSCGDAVLSTLGATLCEIFSPEDILCRWGGDEFILLIKGEGAQEESLYASLHKLQKSMQTVSYLENSLSVTLSVGGVIVSPGMAFESLFELADSTLYAVKNEGRNHFRVVSPTLDDHVSNREDIE